MEHIKFYKIVFVLIICFQIIGCSADKDCMKTITIPGLKSNNLYYPDVEKEVPCDYEIPAVKEPKLLTNYNYEVLSFNFTPDTGRNTARLQFDIKFNNLNNFSVKGYPYFTLNIDGTEISSGWTDGAITYCTQLDAQSSCVFSFDKESPITVNKINSIKLIAVKYYLLN